MVAFDQTGAVRWTVANEEPQIATADGGVIGKSGIRYDQGGNVTGQMASLPTYSWLGYAYQIGTVDQIAQSAIDFALSFAAFQGTPSGKGTFVKLAPSKMFVPPTLNTTPGADDTYFNLVRTDQDLKATRVVNEILRGPKATVPLFLDALAKTNMVVSYIGHGLLNPFNHKAMGICFGTSETTCAVAKPLTEITLDDGSTGTLSPGEGVTWRVLDGGFAHQSKIVFVAACGIDQKFIDQWHIQPGQALIVPKYTTTNEESAIDLGFAAWEWKSMLITLAQGKTVSEAVSVGNQTARFQGAQHSWIVVGDGNVKMRLPN
jgi:hypothetical protein